MKKQPSSKNSIPQLTYIFCYYFCWLLLLYKMESIFSSTLRIVYYTYISSRGTGVDLLRKVNVHRQVDILTVLIYQQHTRVLLSYNS